jgi:hypothetical protein
MNNKFHAARLRIIALSILLALSTPAIAKITAEQAARLGNDLTPLGGEMAGNADGTIPAYTGGMQTVPPGWTPEQGYIDPFADEQPLFTITAANMAQYEDKLSAGMRALLAKYPQFKMPIYPSHRTASLPANIEAKVKKEAVNVELNGFGLANLNSSTTPFPIPANGLEAIWNHNTRYLGGGVKRNFIQTPVRASGSYSLIRAQELRVYNQNLDHQAENRLFNFIGKFLAPASLVGNIALVHEPIDQVKEPRSAWIYSVGQRRVRRAPIIAYDTPIEGSEGLITNDDYDAFNGAPDRYDWKLLGKQEMYVGYNAYRIASKELTYDQILSLGTPNADLMRYELHRVWIVEATSRDGSRHVYGRRTFYIDEDSWSILATDAYDSRGQLWRAGLYPLVQYYDAQVPWYSVSVWHDLNSGNYMVSGLANEERDPWQFGVRAKAADFEPAALRRLGN